MSDEPTAVILAAGEGRRLAPLTNRRPKPMLPIANRPLLEYVIEAVAAAGIDDVVLVVGYERDRIQTHVGDGDDWDVTVRYAVQETQLGTGHAVLQAEEHVDGEFVVLNGDRIIDPEAVTAVREFLASDYGEDDGDEVAMTVSRNGDPGRYGVVDLDGDRVTEVVEKPPGEPPSELINAGVYGFDESIFPAIRETAHGPDGEIALTRALESRLADGRVRALRYDGRWLDVSQLWDLLDVSGQVLDAERPADGADRPPGAADEAVVTPSAAVAGTASIAPNATVGRGVAVGENARIGANAVVERSVVFPDATVEAGAVVRDAVVAENATVGANATIGGGEATVVVEGEVHEDVRLGGVVGDNARVGAAAVLEPGALVYDGATVGPGALASGVVEEDATVRRG